MSGTITQISTCAALLIMTQQTKLPMSSGSGTRR